jgi:Fe-S-cluster containining protein
MDDADYLALMAAVRRQAEVNAALEKEVARLTEVAAAALALNEGQRQLLARRPPAATAVVLADTEDKYQVVNADVDCGARMHLCHGRCCSFNVKMSRQDLEENRLRFRIDEPYHLARNAEGYCVYQSRETGFCGTYQDRPARCREYTCRDDNRIWIDFDRMIPAPMPNGLVTIRRKVP